MIQAQSNQGEGHRLCEYLAQFGFSVDLSFLFLWHSSSPALALASSTFPLSRDNSMPERGAMSAHMAYSIAASCVCVYVSMSVFLCVCMSLCVFVYVVFVYVSVHL